MNKGIWVAVLAVPIAIAALGGAVWWGWVLFLDQAREALQANAVVQEHVGSIASMELDFVATGEVSGEDVFVFDLVGTKGSGRATGRFVTVDADTEELVSGSLELPSGEVYDLFP